MLVTFAALVLVLLPTGASASFSMVVEHGVEECFIIRAPKEKSIMELGIEKGSKVVGGLPWLRLG